MIVEDVVFNLIFRVAIDNGEFGLFGHLILKLVIGHIRRHNLDRHKYGDDQECQIDDSLEPAFALLPMAQRS